MHNTLQEYVCLLRGINVGGNNTIAMSQLRTIFADIGFENVFTYINSGNIIFSAPAAKETALADSIANAIAKETSLSIPVLVLTKHRFLEIAQAIPDTWLNNAEQKTDVLFLWEASDTPDSLAQLNLQPTLEQALYVPGAIIWNVSRANQAKSRMNTIIGTPFYKLVTVRNCNTTRSLKAALINRE
jgi:uncharacterized protein (DUF1697 family)